MKKYILPFMFLLGLFSISAQNYTEFQKKRADMFSNYISENMELTDDEQQFVYNVMLARVYNSNAKIKSENLTAKEDKQAVYSAEYKVAQQKLAEKFGAKMARKMMSLSNDARKKTDNK